jgi:hypothetical protein
MQGRAGMKKINNRDFAKITDPVKCRLILLTGYPQSQTAHR